MTTLRELADADIDGVLLNPEDFCETHILGFGEDAREIACVIDSDELSQRSPELGVETAGIRLHARADAFEDKLQAGDLLTLDNRLYVVVSWSEDMGFAQVALTSAQR